jgi:hypothetical protein
MVGAARVISRLVLLVDFERFLEVMTPQVAAAIIGLLPIDDEVADIPSNVRLWAARIPE